MKLEGKTYINAPRTRAYDYFTDAHFVSQCAPGVEKVEELEAGKKFRVVVSVGFGMVKATFNTDIEFVEKRLNEYAKIKAVGKAPGSGANVTAELYLTDAPQGGTDLKWVADVVITGTIAIVANRLMGSVTQMMSKQFFDCAKGKIEAQA
ncbi:MAG: SRPBCC domain-containing protein [Anaerolineae bacterium]|nr:SRPBCC domain-containing protein [Anaerolineae bacterium]